MASTVHARISSLFAVLLAAGLLLSPGSLYAQEDLTPAEMQKLGLRLQPVVEALSQGGSRSKAADAGPGPIAAEPFRGGEGRRAKAGQEPTYAVFVYTSDPEALESTGAQVDSRFSGFVTARATAPQLRSLAKLEDVQQVRASGWADLHNDEAAGFVGARALNNGLVEGTEYTGEGVAACVIDSGIDYDHPDFMDDSGNSRIISIWDQTDDTDGQTPYDRHSSLFSQGGFDYGTEYHTSEIEKGGLSTKDTNGHGTHVAGTVGASGNADSAGKYKGMAPGVNFIIIRASTGRRFQATDWINGLSFCDKIAEQKGLPMVANMSLGGHGGPHDGTSARASAVDQILENGSAPGRSVVISAGNEGRFSIHNSQSISASTSKSLDIVIPSYSPESGTGNDRLSAQLWFKRDVDVEATVTTPNGATLTASPGETVDATTANDGTITIENTVYSGNGDRFVQIIAADPTESNTPSSGTWSVSLKNNSSSSATVDGWIWPYTIGTGPSLIQFPGGDTQSTVGIPGTATHAITVGSFMHRWRWYGSDESIHYSPPGQNRSGDISLFSSEGPRRDGTGEAYKPEIAAPGQNVISSLSQDASASSSKTIPGGMHVQKQGTSMASPVVAGSVALLLEEDPSLTPTEIKTLITQTADTDGFTGSTPNTEWGYGRLDILEAMTQLVNSSGSATYSIFSNDSHPNESYEGFYTLGGEGAGAHAIRFTPSNDGRLSGAYFHLYYPVGNELTDSLTVEIRTDNGGVPGAQIGSSVNIAPSRLRTGTWNYQSLLGTDTQLNAGQDYYLVYYPSKPDDALYVMGENYAASGNSLYLSSGTWQEDSSYDLLVRPVVSSLSGVQVLPVELVAFGAEVSGQSATLSWQTASETNNARFEVQQQGEEGGWTTVGQVEGAGTTTETQRYSHEVTGLSYGTHRFRLRQVDLDGTAHTSKKIKAVVKPTEGLSVQAYPNPVSTTATVKVATGQSQDVTVHLYDLLGRQVAQLHEGTVSPKRPETLTLEGSNLSSGTYFLRVDGESGTKTERLSIVR